MDGQNGNVKGFCTKCGAPISGNERFCKKCGNELRRTEGPSGNNRKPSPQNSHQNQGRPEKKSSKKVIGIVAGIVLLLAIAAAAFFVISKWKEGDSGERKEAEEQDDRDGDEEDINEEIYELYESLQDNETMPYTIEEKAGDFLTEYSDLFPASSDKDIKKSLVDESLDAESIIENPEQYGDKLMALEELAVVQIFESGDKEGEYFTEINSADANGQQYYIMYNGQLSEISENDMIDVWALPLGISEFENTEGGQTTAVVMAGSYVEKLDKTVQEATQEAAEETTAPPETEAPAAAVPSSAAQPETTAAQNVTYQTMYVVNCNESITLRTSPSTSAAEIRQIPLGAAVSYIETAENGFYKVVYLGNTGYALASYLSYEKQETPVVTSGTMRVVNCNESITLRTSPSTSAAEICQIPLGATVGYIGTAENGFYKVSYLGNTGYALASYLSSEGGAAAASSYRTMRVVNCNESITLRTSPSTSAAEIRQIPLGAVVSYVGTAENGFYKVIYLGNTGYALASYLQFE